MAFAHTEGPNNKMLAPFASQASAEASAGRQTRLGHMAFNAPAASADKKIVETHPAWEDWLGAGLGFLIALTPSLVSETVDKGIQLNTALIGILVLLVPFLERVRLHHWEEVAEIVFGAWLIHFPLSMATLEKAPCDIGILPLAGSSSCSPCMNFGKTGTQAENTSPVTAGNATAGSRLAHGWS